MKEIKNCFGYNNTWFAVKGVDADTILSELFHQKSVQITTWEVGLSVAESSQTKVFLSGPYQDWSFLVGKALWNPEQTEHLIEFLLKIGEIAEEVCYFSSYRTVGLYGFAKVFRGEIVRLYCYTDESGHIYKNIGNQTNEEKDLGLNFAAADEELFEDGFDEIDEDIILELAGKMSLHPECLIGMEERKSIIIDICYKDG